jgi:hypothetical protein
MLSVRKPSVETIRRFLAAQARLPFTCDAVGATAETPPAGYVVDETGPLSKFGFAYGTLPGYVESGEEHFLIEWDQGNDGVWCDILAFSRPNQFSARLGYFVVRRLQKRFGQDSASSMLRAICTDNKGPVE